MSSPAHRAGRNRSTPPAQGPRGRGTVAGLPDWDRCAVVGVVNVTPDSFSDGGHWFATAAAVKRGLSLVADGADLVDVGGEESTRPGASRVDEHEELRRVIPVVRGLAAEGVLVSVDTMRASVARRAVEAGAVLVNDVSGGLADPAMIPAVVYGDVVAEVVSELRDRIDAAAAAGIAPERLVVDPGLGFAKEARYDLGLVAGLADLRGLGRPVLVAGSRERFLGHVLADADGTSPPAHRRDAATAALSAIAAHRGAWAVRVHDVRATADAVRVARAVTPPA
ncbi:dihydropteroate synthase [Streptomyces sp. NPDC041003]|uniref:dihydropteroate synthase n=1 Tax=Streptomyces sp. NPDC041003 TaxID=3155730 RepID=UPI0033D5FEDF